MTSAIELANEKRINFGVAETQLIKDTLCKGATDNELKLFVEMCKSRNLNPFASQLHFVKRWDSDLQREVGAYQTGIGGFRSISESTGEYAGETDVLWYDKDGKEYKVWTLDENPIAASAGVMRKVGKLTDGSPVLRETREMVYWDSVCQKKNSLTLTKRWTGKAGAQQLGKCAKGAAHRAGFGEVLGAIYMHEEMAHLESDTQQETRMKQATTVDFVSTLSEGIVVKMNEYGYDTEAKKRSLCNESENNLDKLILHLEAVEFLISLTPEIQEKVKFAGYKNRPEARRMLVKLGKEKWNENDLKLFLDGEVMP